MSLPLKQNILVYLQIFNTMLNNPFSLLIHSCSLKTIKCGYMVHQWERGMNLWQDHFSSKVLPNGVILKVQLCGDSDEGWRYGL